jgi:hypothetical protein
MMTDKEKWEEFLRGFGIGFQHEARFAGETALVLHEGMPKVTGYFMFCTVVVFDEKGVFKEIGAYE